MYCLRHPQSLGRNLMVGASAPGFATLWEPAEVDRGIRRYADLWRQDPKCALRTTDLEGAVRSALSGLPREWKGVLVDPDSVKLAAFKLLYDTATAVQALDAFVSATEGDWGGLALLSAASGTGTREAGCPSETRSASSRAPASTSRGATTSAT